MYEGTSSCDNTSSDFLITIGLHRGSSWSPYLFSLVMDELTKDIQHEVPWCISFDDDIVLIDEIRESVSAKFELWRSTFESKGYRLSLSNSGYSECEFSNVRRRCTSIVNNTRT